MKPPSEVTFRRGLAGGADGSLDGTGLAEGPGPGGSERDGGAGLVAAAHAAARRPKTATDMKRDGRANMRSPGCVRPRRVGRGTSNADPRFHSRLPARPGPDAAVRRGDGLVALLRGELAELAAARRVAQLAECVGLDLADALARQTELVPDLLERPGTPVVEAEAKSDDPLLAALEAVENPLDLLAQHLVRHRVERRDGILVLDEAAELCVALVADWRFERDRQAAVAANLVDPISGDRPAGILGQGRRDLFGRRLTTELDRQLALGPGHPVHGLDHVDGDPDGPRLVGETTLDRLADPPRRVRRELETALPFELVDGTHQAGIALLDEVEQAHAAVHVLLGIRDDQPEVGRREVLPSGPTHLDEETFRLARRLGPVPELGEELGVVAGLDPATKRRDRDLVARPGVHRHERLLVANGSLAAGDVHPVEQVEERLCVESLVVDRAQVTGP